MDTVLIIGSSGLLGSSLIPILKKKYNIISVTRSSKISDFNLDMSDEFISRKLFSDIQPDYIINLAAVTDVDGCESDLETAYLINTKLSENIARYNISNPSTFTLHISTDHFYDKNNSNENMVRIYNNYAMTKYSAECSYPKANVIILRTNFFGKSHSLKSVGLCNSIYEMVKKKNKLKLFNDVFFSPLSINTLCNIIDKCLEEKIPGIYNVGSRDGMSKEEFLTKFLYYAGLSSVQFESVSVDSMGFKVKRPKDMRMDVSLFEHTYKCTLPTLNDEIKRVSNEFKE